MEIAENGYLRPRVVGELSHRIMDDIIKVCPATRLEGLPDSKTHGETDPVWGVWQRLVLAYAVDQKVRHLGATGGLSTALALFLLDSNEVDFILHAQPSIEYPTFGDRAISQSPEEVLQAAGSRYGPTATLLDIDEILSRKQPFAFIGKPCDVSALGNLSKIDQRVNEYCRYKVAIVCGGFMTPTAMNTFLEAEGVPYEELKNFRYRGHGCPGKTRLEAQDGTVVEKTYLEFWGDDEASWDIPFRCKVCPDGIGDGADIAISDTWDGGSPDPAKENTDPGTNAAILRTNAGVALMENAKKAGFIGIEGDITTEDLDRYQPHQVTKKRKAWARFAGLKSAGRVVPETKNLRITRLARENSLKENLFQARGTKARAYKADESPKN